MLSLKSKGPTKYYIYLLVIEMQSVLPFVFQNISQHDPDYWIPKTLFKRAGPRES